MKFVDLAVWTMTRWLTDLLYGSHQGDGGGGVLYHSQNVGIKAEQFSVIELG